MHIGRHISGPGFWIETQLGVRLQETLFDWLFERATNPSAKLIRMGIMELFPYKQAPNRLVIWLWRGWPDSSKPDHGLHGWERIGLPNTDK